MLGYKSYSVKMIANSLEKDHIHSSTYGSIPQRTTQDAVIEKVLSMDSLRINKISGAIFDCEAKGCYDRIIAALMTITCRRLEVPRTTHY